MLAFRLVIYYHACIDAYIYKASQPRGRASGSRAYGRQEMQGVIFKSTRHECSVFVNLRPLLLRIRSRHQFSSPEKNPAPTAGFEPTFIRLPDGTHNHSAKGEA